MPILNTATGTVGEYLKQNSCGALLEKDNFAQWTKQFSDFIEKNNINICDQAKAHKVYGWDYAANKFVDSFKFVIDDFYKKNA